MDNYKWSDDFKKSERIVGVTFDQETKILNGLVLIGHNDFKKK